MEKISWTDLVNKYYKEERNMTQTIKIRKGKWIGHISHGNCILKQVIEGRI
jgi:hypothetical protein